MNSNSKKNKRKYVLKKDNKNNKTTEQKYQFNKVLDFTSPHKNIIKKNNDSPKKERTQLSINATSKVNKHYRITRLEFN